MPILNATPHEEEIPRPTQGRSKDDDRQQQIGDIGNRLRQRLAGAGNPVDEQRQEIGNNGRRLMEERYSWEKIGQRLDAIYQHLL